MKKFFFIKTIIPIIVLVSVFSLKETKAQDYNYVADTLMQRIFTYPQKKGKHIGHYESIVYTKFHIDSDIHNSILKLIPHSIDVKKGKNHYFGENLTKYNFVDFGVINRKELAFFSTMDKLRKIPDILHNNLNAMVYEPTIYVDCILSPFNKRSHQHYKYAVDSVRYINNKVEYLLSFTPRHHNTQLIKGNAWVEYDTGKINNVIFKAIFDKILHVDVNLKTGDTGSLSMLPKDAFIKLFYTLGGNTVSINLDSHIIYDTISNIHYADSLKHLMTDKYDITSLNLIPFDTTNVVRSKDFFDYNRPIPLTYKEDSIYSQYENYCKSKPIRKRNFFQKIIEDSSFDDIFLSKHHLKFNDNSTLSIPPVFTPSMFQWSGSRGVSLQARIHFQMNFSNSKMIKLKPRIGYSFKQKQTYWNVPINVLLFPKIGAGFESTIKNGNHIYSSLQAKEIRKELGKHSNYDSLLNVFNHYNFNYYNDFSVSSAFYIEPIVGLKLHTGLTFHQRHLINWNNIASTNGMKRYYKSIAPYIDMEYTPALYYHRAGNRRIPLYSYWPEFRFTYEKGIHKWGCNSKYERWEFDASYKINLRALSSIYIRGGGGFFTDRKDMFFVDYDNFKLDNMPSGWEDDMLGEFQLLNSHWYNESNYYTLLCTAYESPTLLLSRAPYISKSIKKERIYINAVSLHALKAYVELGYGISTNFFDGAIFTGIGNVSKIKIGAKVALRFFEKW